jgi:arsenite/tail-anchored protein-transporting ATPase
MRILTFTGKGGVGKSSVSAATAVRLYDEPPIKFVRNGDVYEVELKLMFANPVDIDIWVTGDELYVHIANQRKIITLPISLTALEPGEAFFQGEMASYSF